MTARQARRALLFGAPSNGVEREALGSPERERKRELKVSSLKLTGQWIDGVDRCELMAEE